MLMNIFTDMCSQKMYRKYCNEYHLKKRNTSSLDDLVWEAGLDKILRYLEHHDLDDLKKEDFEIGPDLRVKCDNLEEVW